MLYQLSYAAVMSGILHESKKNVKLFERGAVFFLKKALLLIEQAGDSILYRMIIRTGELKPRSRQELCFESAAGCVDFNLENLFRLICVFCLAFS